MYCERVPRPTARITALTVGIRPRKQKQNVIGVVMWNENGKNEKRGSLASDKNGQNLARLWVLVAHGRNRNRPNDERFNQPTSNLFHERLCYWGN